MKLEHGILTIGTDNFFVELSTEWRQLWGKYNWITMTIIELYFENDIMTGGFEAQAALLGFVFRLRWNYDPSRLDEIKDR